MGEYERAFEHGVEQMSHKNWKAAESTFSILVLQNPKSFLAWRNLGICKTELRLFAEAERNFCKVLELNPFLPEVYGDRIVNFVQAGQASLAFEIAIEGFEKFPESKGLLKMAIEAALRAEQMEQAIAWIRAYLKLVPQDVQALSHLVLAQLSLKKFTEVHQTAELVFAINPSEPNTHLHLALTYFEEKNWKRAQEHLLEAKKAKPEDPFILQGLREVEKYLS